MRTVPSHIQGLDKILGGGFFRPSVVLIGGLAGSGKTTLVMESLFRAAANDEVSMYVTSLNEPIAMVNNFMSQFDFYNMSLLAKGNVKYISLAGETDIIDAIQQHIEIIKPDRIAIDSLNTLALGKTVRGEREFYYDLFSNMRSWNSLVYVTAELSPAALLDHNLSYLADAILHLSNDEVKERRQRHVEVLKLRGHASTTGKYPYKIAKKGIKIFPPLIHCAPDKFDLVRISTGVKGIDEMTGGGVIRGTSTIISGSAGTGKTILGLSFIIEGLEGSEPAIIICFEEEAAQLKAIAESFGWDFSKHEKNNLVKIIHPDTDCEPCELALEIQKIVEERGIKRILVDGLNSYYSLYDDTSLFRTHVEHLSNYFKSKKITSVFTNETTELMGSSKITEMSASFAMDSVILLRYVEIGGEMKKAISVLKMRGSNHDKNIREFIITDKGLKVANPFSDYTGLMGGSPLNMATRAFVDAFKNKKPGR